MTTNTRGGGTLTEAADRTPRTTDEATAETQVARFTRPWTTDEVAEFCGFTTRHLYALRNNPTKQADQPFPEPLAGSRLLWWPGEVVEWMGLDLADVLAMAAAVDAACGVRVAPSAPGRRTRRGGRR